MFAQPDEEDEEFIVIKAGPQLPIRRPRKNQLRDWPNASAGSIEKTTANVDIYAPQTLLVLKPPVTLDLGESGGHHSRSVQISQVIPPNRKTISSIPKPILHPLKVETQEQAKQSSHMHINHNQPMKSPLNKPYRPTTPVESKVRKYIENVKKLDEENRLKAGRKKRNKFLSLEDLYQVSKEPVPEPEVEDKLRQTLRIIKEKDEMILRLRESCHELKLKWADAQNRIDDMRFGIGLEDTGKRPDLSILRSSSVVNLSGPTLLSSSCEKGVKEQNKQIEARQMKDQATEMDVTHLDVSQERQTKKRDLIKSDVTEEGDPLDQDDFDVDDLSSQFDPVLEEKCSNWMEKVQNWKTDSACNLSQDKDSCGDRDSGFRGSAAELELGKNSCRHCCNCRKSSESHHRRDSSSNCMHHHHSHNCKQKSSCIRRPSKLASNKPNEVPARAVEPTTTATSGFCSSKSPTPDRNVDNHLNNLSCDLHDQADADAEDSGPSSLHIAPPWLSFPSHVNPQSATEYEGFPSFTSSYQSHPLNLRTDRNYPLLASYYAKSMDALHPEGGGGGGDSTISSSSIALREVEKRFRTLHPLLDDATSAALRVKYKSDKLSQILRKETEELKEMRKVNINKRMSLT